MMEEKRCTRANVSFLSLFRVKKLIEYNLASTLNIIVFHPFLSESYTSVCLLVVRNTPVLFTGSPECMEVINLNLVFVNEICFMMDSQHVFKVITLTVILPCNSFGWRAL